MQERKKYNPGEARITIEGNEISKVASTPFLGVMVDEKYCWKEHIDMITKKVAKSVGIVKKNCPFLNRACLKTLYYSLIYPYLTYCNIVWASTYPSYLQKLYVLQKKFVRLATKSTPLEPSAPLFATLNILTIFNINILQTCIFTYKTKYQNSELPDHFQQYFQSNSSFHSHQTRQSNQLHVPLYSTTRGQFSLKYKGVSSWNAHSHLMTNSSSLSTYKRSLINKLIAQM